MSQDLLTDPETKSRDNARGWSGFRRLMTVIIWGILIVFSTLSLFILVWPAKLGIVPVTDGAPTIYLQIALAAIVMWFGILINFYVWTLYFYNVNFGYTDHSWEKMLDRYDEALRRRDLGMTYEPGDLKLPDRNPYKGETLGLPNGTVRGTLALSLLVGGMAILIYSFGGVEESFNTQIDFFLRAFIMMVAFYFGTKALSILEGENKSVQKVSGGAPVPRQYSGIPTPQTVTQPAPVPGAGVPVPTGGGAQIIAASFVTGVSRETRSATESLKLSNADIREAAQMLGVEEAALKAVIAVEVGMNANGFLENGQPKILFEGHVFWRQLKAAGLDPATFAVQYPNIVHRGWNPQNYVGGAGEYNRLRQALEIHRESALKSASWGTFQIMGFNHKTSGFRSVDEFVEAHYKGAREHLEAFSNFLKNDRGGKMHEALKKKDWATFARYYNGPSYATHKYDVRLENSYKEFKRTASGGGVRVL